MQVFKKDSGEANAFFKKKTLMEQCILEGTKEEDGQTYLNQCKGCQPVTYRAVKIAPLVRCKFSKDALPE